MMNKSVKPVVIPKTKRRRGGGGRRKGKERYKIKRKHTQSQKR